MLPCLSDVSLAQTSQRRHKTKRILDLSLLDAELGTTPTHPNQHLKQEPTALSPFKTAAALGVFFTHGSCATEKACLSTKTFDQSKPPKLRTAETRHVPPSRRRVAECHGRPNEFGRRGRTVKSDMERHQASIDHQEDLVVCLCK